MPRKVLVIDDDQNAVKYVSAVLSEHGYDPVPAFDGSEGLQQIKQAKPDLIVLDVMMPKKSGLVLLKQLKSDQRYKDIPVLMISGAVGLIQELESQEDDTLEKPYDSLREALKNTIRGMREEGLVRPEMFLDKPIDPDTFIARVRELLGG